MMIARKILCILLLVFVIVIPSRAMGFDSIIFSEGSSIQSYEDGTALWTEVTYISDKVINGSYTFPEEVFTQTEDGKSLGSKRVIGFAAKDLEDETSWHNDYDGVTQVILPSSYTMMPQNTFHLESILSSFDVKDGNPVLQSVDGVLYDKQDNRLVAYPNARSDESYEVLAGTKVISPRAFGKNKHLKKITLPDSLERIEHQGMRVGRQLKDLILPDNLKVIGRYAFEGTDLGHLHLPESLEFVDGNPFIFGIVPKLSVSENHPVLMLAGGQVLFDKVRMSLLLYPTGTYTEKDYQVPAFVKTIGSGCFYNVDFTRVPVLQLPEGLEEIHAKAFYSAKLSAIELPSSLKVLEYSAFLRAEGLKSIIIPSNINTVSKWCFGLIDSLEEVVLQEGVEKIDSAAFWTCSNIKTLSLPTTLKEIGEEAFVSCEQLQQLIFPEGIEVIGSHAFAHNYSLKQIILPSSMNQLGSAAFSYCKNINKIVIPGGIKRLKYACFSNNSSLSEVSLAEGLEVIEGGVFENCPNLKSLILPRSLISLDESAFYNTPVTLKVYSGSTVEDLVKKAGLKFEVLP
ncbi:MAG: leucine-rich repeat domain-containing protein [Clostridiales bacterium]|nr:leucine-rich repeat domain-containing protein [Clostridiales bacterium]